MIIRNKVIKQNDKRRAEAVTALTILLAHDEAGTAALRVLAQVLDEYEDEILRLEDEERGKGRDNAG